MMESEHPERSQHICWNQAQHAENAPRLLVKPLLGFKGFGPPVEGSVGGCKIG